MATTSGDPMSEFPLQQDCPPKAEQSASSQVNAVRVELPQFDLEDIDTWLLMCENLLHDARVVRQDTMFRKILAKLPAQYFRMVKHLVLQQPLAVDCFDQLKTCLRDRLGLAPSERLRKLEHLPPSLGDMKPSQLYGQLEQLYPNDVDHEIIREMFLKRLPLPISILCREKLKSHQLAQVAYMADAHLPLQSDYPASTLIAQAAVEDVPFPSSSDSLVAAAGLHAPLGRSTAPRRRWQPARVRGHRRPPRSERLSDFVDRWCRIHQRYGPQARNCLGDSAAIGNGYNSPLLFVRDVTGRRFLVDSGSEVSILPAQPPGPHRPLPGGPKLKAANGTTIDVFQTGRHEILDLGLGRTYPFKFVVAAVPNAILGADFLRQHGLIPDLKAARLRDGVTFLSATCSHCRRKAAARLVHVKLEHNLDVPIDGPSFQHVRNTPMFLSLADTPGEFPAVTMPGIQHCIQTRGPPAYARPRRLVPAKLDAAKRELDELVRRGILVPSQSQWASPIHLVPKDKGNCYRMVGCYERLNAITLPDRYPIPDIQTFADHLHGATIFSKIDLARAFAQIRMSPEDQQKTAITTPFGLYEYTRMPFGLRNAAQTFQRLMDSVFRGTEPEPLECLGSVTQSEGHSCILIKAERGGYGGLLLVLGTHAYLSERAGQINFAKDGGAVEMVGKCLDVWDGVSVWQCNRIETLIAANHAITVPFVFGNQMDGACPLGLRWYEYAPADKFI
ncbi:hypothetical protein M514_20461 [Trichuris suis]|uniref:Uncharacterized protein n=1 Tax=Trichuris suis TaxID=68888 RepID=A0A085ND79_9BILA|nr:hypothetical protein M514_20461 [Trichuris suis]